MRNLTSHKAGGKVILSLILAALAPCLALAGDFESDKGVIATEAPAPYEAGRGLITLEGPTGMFINPTSATLPQGAFTAQYCFFAPDLNNDNLAHGWLAAYGLTDALEVGVVANYVDVDSDPFAIGPYVRARLMKNAGLVPQVSIGYYGRYGDDILQQNGVFAAAYNRFGIGDESGFFKALGLHYGLRANWYENDYGPDDAFRGYFGAELQMPYRLYLVGEISTEDEDFDQKLPFSYGLQWRAAGVNISAAMVQPGYIEGGPGFYFGIGSQLTF